MRLRSSSDRPRRGRLTLHTTAAALRASLELERTGQRFGWSEALEKQPALVRRGISRGSAAVQQWPQAVGGTGQHRDVAGKGGA